jgi:hypothetical protein
MTPTPKDEMERVVITQPVIGICYMQVCAVEDATDKEILAVCNYQNPSGTSLGWGKVCREDADECLRPLQCQEFPGRKHFLIMC